MEQQVLISYKTLPLEINYRFRETRLVEFWERASNVFARCQDEAENVPAIFKGTKEKKST